MSGIEEFLNKRKPRESLSYVGSEFQCKECDEFTKDSYFDEIEYSIIWYCNQDHESKVKLV